MLRKNVDVRMVTHFKDKVGEEWIDDTCFYSDYWFLDDSYDYNSELALMSAMVDGASYCTKTELTGTFITTLLQGVGFSDIQLNQYYSQGVFLTNSIGAVIGKKTIKDYAGKEYTLLALFPRNAGYQDEWYGNFNLGDGPIHEGFRMTRDEMLRFLKSYIDSNNIRGDLKIWTAGYSRGAATVNLLSGFLAEDSSYLGDKVSLEPKNLFAYNIATPNNIAPSAAKDAVLSVSGARGEGFLDTDVPAYVYTGATATIDPTAQVYGCIHNNAAVGDFVAKLPSAEMGFTRYGSTEKILYGDEAMVKELKKWSPSTAALFEDGRTYASKEAVKTINLQTLTITDTDKKVSVDEILDERIAALVRFSETFGGLQRGANVLGAAASVFGTDLEGFANGVSGDIGGIVKAALLSYVVYAQEQLGLGEGATIAKILESVFAKEKAESYTDQQFLADFLDFFINDYQTDAAAMIRSMLISGLIPDPYGELFLNVLDYAKQNSIQVKTVDDVVLLISKYITEKKETEDVQNLVSTLAGLVPSNYLTMLPAIAKNITGKDYSDKELYPDDQTMVEAMIFDLLECFINGSEPLSWSGPYTRAQVLTLVGGFLLSGDGPLYQLILNGTHAEDGSLVTKDPAPLGDTVEGILDLALPKDDEGKRVPLKELANQAIIDILNEGKTERNGAYIDMLIEDVEVVRRVLLTLVFNPGEEYNFQSDLDNAYQVYTTMSFVYPVHNHELYIAYLKTKVNPVPSIG